MKRTPIRRRSPKMSALYVLRRQLVAELLESRPWCEIRWDNGCEGRAVDVDEVLSRAQGGSITDERNLQTACRHCHRQKHLNPAEAVRRGYSLMRSGGCPIPEADHCTDGTPCIACPRAS